jgi:hypothetical protein
VAVLSDPPEKPSPIGPSGWAVGGLCAAEELIDVIVGYSDRMASAIWLDTGRSMTRVDPMKGAVIFTAANAQASGCGRPTSNGYLNWQLNADRRTVLLPAFRETPSVESSAWGSKENRMMLRLPRASGSVVTLNLKLLSPSSVK